MLWTFPSNVFIDILLFIYVILELRYIIHFFTQKDKESSFSQVGPVEITLVIIIIGIIVWSLRESGKTKQLKKANEFLDVKANYNKALETYIGIKNWEKAGETVVKSPPGTQIVLLRRLQAYLPQSKLKSIFMKLGEYYSSRHETNNSASAFLLAEMPWRAAQSYITGNNVNAAIDVINTTPIFSQDKNKATRNLAKYAFDNNYSLEAAQLLQSIGAEDEAVAVLIAAGRNSNILKSDARSQARQPSPTNTPTNSASVSNIPSSSRVNTSVPLTNPVSATNAVPVANPASTQYSEISKRSDIIPTSPFTVIMQELAKSQAKIKEGKIGDAEEILQRYTNLLDKIPLNESEESTKLRNDFIKVNQAIKRLNDARNAFRNRKIEEAQVIYSELLETTGDLFNAEIFAEAGLAYEYEPADKELASEFFVEASKKAKTTQASQRYKERADILLESMNESLPEVPKSEKAVFGRQLTINPSEKCCVCRRPIGTEGEVVQCNNCKSVAHYPHMAEWLKIKGVCPVCKQKLSMPETTKVALTE